MLSNEELFYFLYMEEQEKKEQQEKVNVNSSSDLVGEQTTQDRNRE